MVGEVAHLKKPVMRGLLQTSIKRNLAIAIALSAVGAAAVKVLIGERRKAKYAEFYKTYNADEAFERMRKAGHLASTN